ncbi:MAG TPA: TIGR01777 family oxidoreductase [Acidimicrobiia bacterium]|nr:TIGR01777 family oxidoreductase [Acidimicrobiia bacterium]
MHIVITGSSGLIGTKLVAALEAAGHTVGRVTRSASGATPGEITWDPAAGVIDAEAFEGVDAVINLNGRSIGERRWTAAEKELVYDSRIQTTRLLAQTLAGLDRKPSVFLSASAVGYYGDRGDEVLTEDMSQGEGFFPKVCADWEAETAPAADAGIRVVTPRTGIVLDGGGGALGRLLAPFGPAWLSPYKWGLGGWIGSGRQWWSWVSMDDTIRAFVHLLTSDVSGPVNVVSPAPATNKQFMKAVGRALRRPVWLPIPKFAMRIFLGSGLAKSTLFDSTRASSQKLEASGFVFEDSDLDAALAEELG